MKVEVMERVYLVCVRKKKKKEESSRCRKNCYHVAAEKIDKERIV